MIAIVQNVFKHIRKKACEKLSNWMISIAKWRLFLFERGVVCSGALKGILMLDFSVWYVWKIMMEKLLKLNLPWFVLTYKVLTVPVSVHYCFVGHKEGTCHAYNGITVILIFMSKEGTKGHAKVCVVFTLERGMSHACSFSRMEMDWWECLNGIGDCLQGVHRSCLINGRKIFKHSAWMVVVWRTMH